MAQPGRRFSVVASDAAPAVPVPPAPALDYYRPPPAVFHTVPSWKLIARVDTTAQWHQARAALDRGHIPALMGDGEDVSSAGPYLPTQTGIALLVPEPEAARAVTILEAIRNGRD